MFNPKRYDTSVISQNCPKNIMYNREKELTHFPYEMNIDEFFCLLYMFRKEVGFITAVSLRKNDKGEVDHLQINFDLESGMQSLIKIIPRDDNDKEEMIVIAPWLTRIADAMSFNIGMLKIENNRKTEQFAEKKVKIDNRLYKISNLKILVPQ